MKKQLIITLTVLILAITLAGAVSATVEPDVKYVSPLGSDDNDGTQTNPYLTIGKGITSVSADGTVNVADGTYYEHLVIDKNLNLVGQSQENTIIDGAKSGRPITIETGAKVSITLLTIRNGYSGSSESGGGIKNNGELTLTNNKLINNTASWHGGAIHNNEGAILKLINCNIVENQAGFHAGAIHNELTAKVEITETSIMQNTANNNGGSIFNWGELTVTDSVITDNHASNWGGGIYNPGITHIHDSLISANTASNSGGGIFNYNTLNIFGSLISANNAIWGGGIYNYYASTLNIVNSVISANNAADYGGGIFNNQAIVTVTDSIISANTAVYGGGIYNHVSSTLNLSNSVISGNTASYDGGAINSLGTVNVSYCTFYDNKATGHNGGAILTKGTLNVSDTLFANNTAQTSGGAIDNWGTTTITHSIFTHNEAYYGGAINNYHGNILATSSRFEYNQAVNGGAISHSGTCTLNYNTFVGNTATTLGPAINNYSGYINAHYNWWGSNNPDFATLIGGVVDYNPWLYMTFQADPTNIAPGETSTLTASFNQAFDGTTVTPLDPVNGHLPDGILVTFKTDLGEVGSQEVDKPTTDGVATATLTATEHGTATVNAALDDEELSDTVEIQATHYNLSVNVTGQGTVTKNPDMTPYPAGTVVTLTAVADPGWSFSHWTGDLTGSTNPQIITMDGDKSVSAVFVEDAPETGIFTRLMVQDAARRVRNFITSRGVLPNWVRMEDTAGVTHYVTMPVFLELSTASLISNANEFKAMDVQTAPRPTGPAIVNCNLYRSGYLNMAVRVNNFIRNNGVAPNFAGSSLGNIRFQSLVDSFARIVAFKAERGVLPNYVVINTRRVR